MIGLTLHRMLEGHIAGSGLSAAGRRDTDHGRQDKSADRGRAHVVGWIGVFSPVAPSAVGARRRFVNEFNLLSACRGRVGNRIGMSARDDGIRIRPGRIRPGDRGAKRQNSFVGEVMRAAKKAGHTGRGFGRTGASNSRSAFGRGRRAALTLSSRSSVRRVVIMARVVRRRGHQFVAAPLARHVAYLKREGVTRSGEDARLFDAASDNTDGKAFAERCAEDRHHFRFIVSPKDTVQMADLRAFTRELMTDAERDLGTKLEWIAVDHWNTDNPHIHIIVRGRADDGRDLVISRDYISEGLRQRAAERVALELGPRTEKEIHESLKKEVEAERWTSLDRALRNIAAESVGFVDLRPGATGEDEELRVLLIGRASKLEHLGLAEPIGPAQWSLKPDVESTLRDLGARGDIIKTMHRAIRRAGREPDVSAFALHGEEPAGPVVGRLVERGLQDELKGTAYAIVEGVDGRTHHLRFADLELTGDGELGAIVEIRSYADANGRNRLSLAVRSDLAVDAQVSAAGATWLDRQLIARDPPQMGGGFGAEVRQAMERRADHLIDHDLAARQGQRVVFARDLLNTLRRRELDSAAARLSAETGLTHHPSTEGEHVAGVYRRRVILASGRFAMLEDGLGFQLVPWRPALEQRLGKQASGVMGPTGVDWYFPRKRGLAR
jgi:type IV secretory pathway VirD2 relaxase